MKNTALQNMLLVIRLRLYQFLLNYSGSGGGKTNGDCDRLWDSNTRPLVAHAVVLLGQLVVWNITDTWDRVAWAYLTLLLRQSHDSRQRSQLLVHCEGYTAETLSRFDALLIFVHGWGQLPRTIIQ